MQAENIEMNQEYMADDESDENTENKNLKELRKQRREIDKIMEEGIVLYETWYLIRCRTIQTYSELDWSGLVERFREHDRYMCDTASNILYNIQELLHEYTHKRHFDLRNYQHLIHDIENIWIHFTDKYIGEEKNIDVCELIVGLSHM